MPMLRRLRKIVSWLVISALLIFLGKFAYEYRAEFENIIFNMQAMWLLPLFLVLGILNLATAGLWALLLRTMECRLSVGHVMAIWHQTLLGKYVPGSIWVHLGRMYQLHRSGVSLKIGAYSSALEQIVILASGLFVILLTPELFRLLSLPEWVRMFFVPLFLVILWPGFLGQIIWKFGYRGFDLRIEQGPSPYFMMLYFGGHIARVWLGGMSILFILFLFGHEAVGLTIVTLASIGAASFIIGYISLLTPGGIGVKEGILVFLLSQYVPVSVAVLVAVSGRLWALLTDGLGAGGGALYLWLTKEQDSSRSALSPTGQP